MLSPHSADRSPARELGALAAALLVFCVAATATLGATPPQDNDPGSERRDENPTSEWVRDNLALVSASAKQIREVLTTDPGLMVELKRVMAKEAAENGQIVAEEDLEDTTILERLDTDARFRALATRLLQRYGYLTPQVNPRSDAGQEQQLLLKARVDQMARGEMPTSSSGKPPCGPGNHEAACQARPAASARPAMSSAPSACGPEQPDACRNLPPEIDLQGPEGNSAPSERQQAPQVLPEDRLNQSPSSLLTARTIPGVGSPGSREASGAISTGDLANVSETNGSFYPSAGSGAMVGTTGMGDEMSPRVPVPAEQPSASLAMRQTRPSSAATSELAGMVRQPSPYAYVPSLYELYQQAAPRSGDLQRFGLDAFSRTPENAGVPMDLPAGPEYVLGPGDGLTIDLWGSVSRRLYRTVDHEGRLLLPEVGPLPVNGKPLSDVQEIVQHVLRTQYRDVSADVSLARLRTVRVYVVGDVASPGAYDVSSLSTPLNALWAAGGVTDRGSLRLVRHARGKQLVEEVDLYDLLLRGIRGDLQNLESGDTLMVPPVGPQVSVDGMVRRPAVYELHGETNLAEVIDLAGGMLPAAALRHIEVRRLEAHEKRTMFGVNIDETGDAASVRRQLASFAVRDGDEVHIYPIAAYNTATVYLQGHVLRPGRYAFTPNMRVTNLLTSYKDLLPEPASHFAEIVRLQQPDWRPVVKTFDLAAAFSNPGASPALEPLDTIRIFGRFEVEAPPTIWVSGQVRHPGQYQTSGQMHFRDAIYQAGGLRPEAAIDSAQLYRTQADGSLKILNVNLVAALDADPFENVLVEPRDRIIVHRSLYRVDPPSVYVKGEVASPGRYPLAADMRLGDLVAAAGGATRGADLENADLMRYRTSSSSATRGEHQKVDLAALARTPDRNLPLKDGDVLSVPQLPGWTSLGATIAVKGEVKNPGIYGIARGERLSSVLKRAGGMLPSAYPQGVIFTRVSVRELQEKTRQDLIQHVEQESPMVKTSLATSAGEAAALQQQALQQRQRILESLRTAEVSGRMVIRMQHDLKGFDASSQDIELQNGDTVTIPKRPDVVLVVGQVYNTNAITYVPNKNAEWYLAQGGGPTQLGDKGAIFIVRANGEVISRHQGGWWSGSVLSTMVRPGDTIVVPERVAIGDTRWRTVLALAQAAEAGAITFAVIP